VYWQNGNRVGCLLQASAHILQNLLLWWNFSATPRGCAFFCPDDVAGQHISRYEFRLPVFQSIEWINFRGCPCLCSRRFAAASGFDGRRLARPARGARLIYSQAVTSGGSPRSAVPVVRTGTARRKSRVRLMPWRAGIAFYPIVSLLTAVKAAAKFAVIDWRPCSAR